MAKGGMYGVARGHAWQGVGVHKEGGMPGGDMHGRGCAWQERGHCSGRYASYWNAFLFNI